MKSLKINAFANIIIKILNIAFPLITGPYVARVLNKVDYGNFNIANTLINFFIPLATLGVYNYGIREISRVIDKKDNINKIFSKLFYVSAFGTILTTFIYYIYLSFNNFGSDLRPLYYILGAQIFSQIFYIEWMNEAFENYTFILYKTLIVRILIFAGIFIFVKKETDIIPYAVVLTVMNSLNFIISFLWIKKDVKFVKISLKDIQKIISPLVSVFLLTNANMLFTVLDRLFLSKVSTPEYVTHYTISLSIVTIIAGVILGAITVNIPRLNYYLGLKDREAYNKLVELTSSIYYFLMMPISIGLMMLSSYTILLYGGKKYVGAGFILGVFSFRIISWSIDVIMSNIIIFVQGYEKQLTINYFIGGGINIVLNIILAINNVIEPTYYIITTIISEYIIIILHSITIKRRNLYSLSKLYKTIIKYLIVSLGFIPIYMIFNMIYPIDLVISKINLLRVFGYMIICAIYYIVINFIIKDRILYLGFSMIFNIQKRLISKLKRNR